jgi:nucleotide-binding universal stress UspA family protein
MSRQPPSRDVPAHIVLATDLSARCDRALDRSAQLAEHWDADLLALNVLDPAALPDQALAWAGGASDQELAQIVRQELHRDLAGLAARATPRIVRSNDPADAIAREAAERRADLVVTGVARSELLGRFLLGSTAERLARTLEQPLLVVRGRTRAPYRRVRVAPDFSAAAHRALQVAARWFAGAELGVYHAHEAPLAGLSSDGDGEDTALKAARQACAAFAADSPVPASCVVERGAVASTLARHVRARQIDLVAVGAKGRGRLHDLLLGNTAAQLLQWLPCDVLLVRAAPEAPAQALTA